jgi:hypothetical protein
MDEVSRPPAVETPIDVAEMLSLLRRESRVGFACCIPDVVAARL